MSEDSPSTPIPPDRAILFYLEYEEGCAGQGTTTSPCGTNPQYMIRKLMELTKKGIRPRISWRFADE